MSLREGLQTAVRQAFADYEKAEGEEQQQEVFINGAVNVLAAIFQPIVDSQERIAKAAEQLVDYQKAN